MKLEQSGWNGISLQIKMILFWCNIEYENIRISEKDW